MGASDFVNPPQFFSKRASLLSVSPTHGTKELVDRLNLIKGGGHVLDLGIGALDLPTDPRIAGAVADTARKQPELIHEFAPVRGQLALREAISAQGHRLHGLAPDPACEVLVTPGGVKGALTVALTTLLNPGDRVLLPIPNWPHYGDMIALQGGIPVPVPSSEGMRGGLTRQDLEANLDSSVRLIILGDCINPTGKIYRGDELAELGSAIVRHNAECSVRGEAGTHVIYDCPYEAHVPHPRPPHIALTQLDSPTAQDLLKERIVYLSGPGKTYGMHGDRVGYLVAPASVVEIAAQVQANTNSFASTYSQVACLRALQEDMDEVAEYRADVARSSRQRVFALLSEMEGIEVDEPDGGYFLFVDFTQLSDRYVEHGHASASSFLLQGAGIACIDGRSFSAGIPGFQNWVRINCGRSPEILEEAMTRIRRAIADLTR